VSYATIDDIRQWLDDDELIQLTDDNDTGAIDTGIVANAIAYADSVIDGYIGTRYKLPLATVPRILTNYCADIAICALYDRRPTGRPEHWRDRCRNADRFLSMVASGKISLGASDPEGTGPAGRVEVSGPDRVFPHTELDRY